MSYDILTNLNYNVAEVVSELWHINKSKLLCFCSQWIMTY